MSTLAAPRLNGRKLQRPWWRAPLIMTGWTVLLSYLVSILAVKMFSPYPLPLNHILHYTLGLGPLWAGLGLGAIGFLLGYAFTQRSRRQADQLFRVTYLSPEHTLTRRVHAMADRLGMPRPQVGYMPDANAYAIGASMQDAAVILGVPLIRGLSSDELDAVIGHELGHIISGDMREMQYGMGFQRMFDTVVAVVGLVVGKSVSTFAQSARDARGNEQFAQFLTGVGRHTAGAGSQLALMWVSRTREFHADAVGAGLTSSASMQSALRKLEGIASPPAGEYACLMFSGAFRGWMATHPSMEQRVAALEQQTYLSRLIN